MPIFAVEPNTHNIVLKSLSYGSKYPLPPIFPFDEVATFIPRYHKNFKICNVGRVEVKAEVKYGTPVSWNGYISRVTIPPGETVVLQNSDKLYIELGLEVYNDAGSRAIICASKEDDTCADLVMAKYDETKFKFDINYNDLLKAVTAAGVGFVPVVGSVLKGLVNALWPSNKPSVWEEIRNNVETLVDAKILQTVQGILNGDIKRCGEQIAAVNDLLEAGQKASAHYMTLARELIGLEEKFSFGSGNEDYKKINFCLLPLYSTVVMMKVHYYNAGVQEAEKIGLTPEEVSQVKIYLNKLVTNENGPKDYISNMYEDRVAHAYENADPRDVFNVMMCVRTYIAINGLEFIPVWNGILKNQTTAKAYNDVISYSKWYQFGRSSANLIKEATTKVLSQPLTPSLINGKRNKLASIDLYLLNLSTTKIAGMKLTFENNESYEMGTVTNFVRTINLKGLYINKLKVGGNGAIDNIYFYLSDGSVSVHGTESPKYEVFEMPKHHIASIFITSDAIGLDGLASNIAVSYQLTE